MQSRLMLWPIAAATLFATPAFSQAPGTSPQAADIQTAIPATRVTPPMRRADEAVGAYIEPSVSNEWLAIPSALATQDAPSALNLFRRSGNDWLFHQTLLSPNVRPLNDGFGRASSIDGDTLVVGAPEFESNGVRSGAVLVYRFDGRNWTLGSTIESPDPVISGSFGRHVSIDDGTLVVGEAREDGPSTWSPNQAAYVFIQRDSDWNLQATIATSADLLQMVYWRGSHGFGGHIAVDGDTLALAARDRVYLYRRASGVWQLEQRLDAPLHIGSGEFGPLFARTLDLEDNTLVVAAIGAAGREASTGAAPVYRRVEGTWREEAKLTASDGATADNFGHWVALSNDTIIAGAFTATVDDNAQSGAAYVFRRIGGAWTQTDKLVPGDPGQVKHTAYALALDSGIAVLTSGSREDPSVSNFIWSFDLGQTPSEVRLPPKNQE